MNAPNKKSPLVLHAEKWISGCGSSECKKATTRVLCRGSIPCDILFIGEAPGKSEDICGQPFIGPAGILLDKIIRRAIAGREWCATCRRGNHYSLFEHGNEIPMCDDGHTEDMGTTKITIAYTNIVGCIPEDDGEKHDPSVEQIHSCQPRLHEFIEIAHPKLIVCVGVVARDWMDPKVHGALRLRKPIPMIDIMHPARILRANIAQHSIMITRQVIILSNAIEDMK